MVSLRNAPGHFLAYGHSNQATFRNPGIQNAYDAIVVPGTIATFYQQATGGFVLALKRPYFIDPRTPLFQQDLQQDEIRASFYTLSRAHGTKIETAVDRAGQGLAKLWVEIRNTYDYRDAAKSWLDYQRGYVGGSSQKLKHYEKLIGRSLGGVQQPAFFTNPYWMASSLSSPAWSMTRSTVAEMASRLRTDEVMVPIIAWKRPRTFGGWRTLERMVESIWEIGNAYAVLIWIDSFREFEEPVAELRALRELVSKMSAQGLRVGMLYGGFFSVLLNKYGLWSFGNGVGYSESRSFPELPSTGAPPPRYYLYGLHRYIQPDIASQILRNDHSGMLQIPAQLRHQTANSDPASLSYHELMTHFVLSRGAEINSASGTRLVDLRDELNDTADYIQGSPILSALAKVEHLRNWAAALS